MRRNRRTDSNIWRRLSGGPVGRRQPSRSCGRMGNGRVAIASRRWCARPGQVQRIWSSSSGWAPGQERQLAVAQGWRRIIARRTGVTAVFVMMRRRRMAAARGKRPGRGEGFSGRRVPRAARRAAFSSTRSVSGSEGYASAGVAGRVPEGRESSSLARESAVRLPATSVWPGIHTRRTMWPTSSAERIEL